MIEFITFSGNSCDFPKHVHGGSPSAARKRARKMPGNCPARCPESARKLPGNVPGNLPGNCSENARKLPGNFKKEMLLFGAQNLAGKCPETPGNVPGNAQKIFGRATRWRPTGLDIRRLKVPGNARKMVQQMQNLARPGFQRVGRVLNERAAVC